MTQNYKQETNKSVIVKFALNKNFAININVAKII